MLENKKGMVLIETLLLFVVVCVLLLIVTTCVHQIQYMEERKEELFQNEEIKEAYQ